MIENLQYALDGGWRVLLGGLIFGAGLPLVFALGIRSYAWGAGGTAEVSGAAGNPVGKLIAGLCLTIVLAGVVLGITIIAAAGFGKAVSFEHGYPTIVATES